VVNIASTEGVGAQPFVSAYTASKHGVIGMTAPIPDDAKAKFARRRIPLRRYGQPEEVAHATLGLVLPAAAYINGSVLLVDGGFSIQN